MESIFVQGGRSLQGHADVPGAKNSALPLMAAAMLCDEDVTLTNVPRLSDVETSLSILRALGCTAHMDAHTVVIHAQSVQESSVPHHLMAAMRSSIFFLAPLLARTGCAKITMPGGCRLGARPIDIHLNGLAAMGACVRESGETLCVTAENGLHGADITLRLPSVGATETLLMAAVTAQGETVLRGAACEPEVQDLAAFLNAMGAQIQGAGTSCLHICGAPSLRGVRFDVCPDRIVAATLLCAVAGCGGEVWLHRCTPSHLEALFPFLHTLGCTVCAKEDTLYLVSHGPKKGLGVLETAVYPGLPTDMAPLLAAAVLRAQGSTLLHDTVFDNRFACAEGFASLGAHAVRVGAAVRIEGVSRLYGGALEAQDLRGGAALVLAALQAQGESVIGGVEYIRRGYEDIVALFESLGADVRLEASRAALCRVAEYV